MFYFSSMENRLFIGVKIHPSVLFLNLYKKIKFEFKDESIKWVPVENMHITLKFLGNTPDFKLPQIKTALEITVGLFQEFTAEIKGLGYFEKGRSIKIIWMGIECGKNMVSLSESLNNNLKISGYEDSEKEFKAHLTLARIKHTTKTMEIKKFLNNYRDVFIQSINVKEVCLFESLLNPKGAEYKIIESFPLKSNF
jgi:RNA 2',3'-cyclic 3'-phosphodiesterase